MKTSQLLLATIKETPADAELISHQLMLRAGMVRKVASGLYCWLPLGYRVVRKVEHIVREEMERAGAQEVLLPIVQPADLWIESGRWSKYGPELLRFKDRHDNDFCLGPTHEEVIVDLARREIQSYKQLPITFFQINTKFRDEIRPRFGVMRSREFVMKDAYSFHIDTASMADTYQTMYQAYCRIFSRLGLDFRPVLADSGAIGGDMSHEFQVLAKSGEDVIAYSDQSDYAANVELATSMHSREMRANASRKLEKVHTPNQTTIKMVAEFLKIPESQNLKTLLVQGVDEPVIALILRGDDELNIVKAEKLPEVKRPLTFVNEAVILEKINCPPGSIGPKDLPVPVIVDHEAALVSDFVCGANEEGYHWVGVNWERDLPLPKVADLRQVKEGDVSPDGRGHLKFTRGIEVGHIFQNGDVYTKPMNITALDEHGKSIPLLTGCYGIGITRIVAAAIEQNHDEHGIIWPQSMAPFTIALLPIQLQKSYRVREVVEQLYQDLQQARIDVLYDDRKIRPGVMFSEMDLIGIPHRLVVSERGIDEGWVEYKARNQAQTEQWPIGEVVSRLLEICKAYPG